jgi:T-complex protein 1 subunit delta
MATSAAVSAAVPAAVNRGKTGDTLGGGTTKGKDVRTSNIIAAKAIATAIRTSLGPRGMDKMVQLKDGQVLISNDGATILSHFQVLHPAAQMLVDLSQSQDVEAGDGTTTVVVLAGALLEACSGLLAKGIHPTVIAQSFLQAADKTCEFYKDMSRPVELSDRESLLHAVNTCLSSKVVAQNSDLLAPIAVDSVLGLLGVTPSSKAEDIPNNVDLRDIRIVQQVGGTVDDTELVHGLVLNNAPKQTTSGAPTVVENAKIALIQFCLSAPKTDMDNTVVVEDYAAMDRLLREERKYILTQCKALKKAGVTVVLIQKSILRDAYNELSLHFLAKMNIMAITDVERSDVAFICRTLGCAPIAHIDQLSSPNVSHYLGSAAKVSHVFLEGASHRVVKFIGVAHQGPTMTVLMRGSNSFVLAEAERSLHDAQCVVRSLIKQRAMIAGGGAPEAQASYDLQQYARTELSGMAVPCFKAFADALEVIPYTLAENAGLKPIEIVTQLRKLHAEGVVGAGVDVTKKKKKADTSESSDDDTEGVSNMYDRNVLQPLLVSTSAVQLATETVCMILKVEIRESEIRESEIRESEIRETGVPGSVQKILAFYTKPERWNPGNKNPGK